MDATPRDETETGIASKLARDVLGYLVPLAALFEKETR
jgi:hypothetical protein